MLKFHNFARLTKVDEAQRLVWGTIAKQSLDSTNEMMDYAGSKPHFETWSAEIAKATGGKSLGNVRVMHKAEVGGKLVEITFNDDAQQIDVCAKVLDDKAWDMVKEGALTGFSIGGRYLSKNTDGDTTTYVAQPNEVSLVDNPCLKAAHFTMVKADGTEVMVDLPVYTPTNTEILDEAHALAKAANAFNGFADFIKPARESLLKKHAAELFKSCDDEEVAKGDEAHGEENKEVIKTDEDEDPEDEESPAKKAAAAKDEAKKAVDSEDLGVKQVWEVGGKTFAKKADAIAHLSRITNPILKAVADAGLPVTADVAESAEIPVADILSPDLGKALDMLLDVRARSSDTALFKGIYNVSRLTDIISSLRFLCDDQCWEAAHGTKPMVNVTVLAGCLKELCAALVEMASEETEALLSNLSANHPTLFTMDTYTDIAEKFALVFGDEAMQKLGARNSSKDQGRLDSIVALAQQLGATCTVDAEKVDTGELRKVIAERDLLKSQIDESVPEVAKLAAELNDLRKSVARLEEQPVPMPGAVLVSKGGHDAPAPEALAELMKGLTPEQLKDVMFKAALSVPVNVGG